MNGQGARGGRVQDAPEANATYPAPPRFCRDDQVLLADVPAVAAFLGPSDEGLIDLPDAGQQVGARTDHRST
jgi:hypothetical protein